MMRLKLDDGLHLSLTYLFFLPADDSIFFLTLNFFFVIFAQRKFQLFGRCRQNNLLNLPSRRCCLAPQRGRDGKKI